jgi:methyl-accepting chemotaxis protein
MLARLSLRMKLLGLCTVLSTLTAVVGFIAHRTLNDVSTSYDHVASINLANVQQLGNMRAYIRKMHIDLMKPLLGTIDPARFQKAAANVDEQVKKYEDADTIYRSVPFTGNEADIYKGVQDEWAKTREVIDTAVATMRSFRPGMEGDLEAMLVARLMPLEESYRVAVNELLAFHDKESKLWVAKAEASAATGVMLIAGTAICSFILAMVMGLLLSNRLAATLRALADHLDHGATEVGSASGQISEASEELSASAAEQAAALQETVSSLDEVSAMVSKNAANARRSKDTSEVGHEAATRGKSAVEDMRVSIEDISRSNADIMQQVESGNQEISSIVKVIAEIGNKTKVINDIVFQTKLLSFNASVEAARAGEHGKGFAVVAEEVGNLAAMSGNAAKEISQMLDDSIRKVERTVTDTRARVEQLIVTGRAKIEAGIVTSRRCGEALDEIVRSVSELGTMVAEISTASQEQAQGVQEITKAMGQLDQVTQQNSAASQHAASAAMQLDDQVGSLRDAVQQLVRTIQGDDGSGQPAHALTRAAAKTPLQRPGPAATVVPLRIRKAGRPPAAPPPSTLKVAVGADLVPSESDARFED